MPLDREALNRAIRSTPRPGVAVGDLRAPTTGDDLIADAVADSEREAQTNHRASLQIRAGASQVAMFGILDKAEREFGEDPEALAAALRERSAEHFNDLDGFDRGLAAQHRATFQRLASTRVRRASRFREARRADTALAAAQAEESALARISVEMAPDLLDDNPEIRASAVEEFAERRNALEASMADRGIKETARGASRRAVDEIIANDAVVGGLERAADKAGFIEAFRSGELEIPWIVEGEIRDVPAKTLFDRDGIDALERRFGVELRRISAERAAAASAVRDDKNAIVKALRTGAASPREVASEIRRIAPALRGSPEDLAELEDAIQEGTIATDFLRASPEAQAEALRTMRDDPSKSVDEIDRLDRLETIHARARESLADDAVAYAERVGWIDTRPLDFSDANPETRDLRVASLRERAAQSKAVEAFTDGFVARPSPLTDPEVTRLTRAMESMHASEQVRLISELSEGLGQEAADTVFERTFPKNPLLAFAASTALADQGLAFDVLVGADTLKAQPELLPPKREYLDVSAAFFRDALRDVSAQVQQTYIDAAKGMAAEAIRREGHAVSGSAGLVFNDDTTERFNEVFEASLARLTGEPVEHNGKAALPPDKRVTQRRFEGMLDRLTDEDLVTFSVGRAPALFRDGASATADEVRESGAFVSQGVGIYSIDIDGLGPLMSPDGSLYLIDLGRAVRERGAEPPESVRSKINRRTKAAREASSGGTDFSKVRVTRPFE